MGYMNGLYKIWQKGPLHVREVQSYQAIIKKILQKKKFRKVCTVGTCIRTSSKAININIEFKCNNAEMLKIKELFQ